MAAGGESSVNDLSGDVSSVEQEPSPTHIPGMPPFIPCEPDFFNKIGKDLSIALTAALSELSGHV